MVSLLLMDLATQSPLGQRGLLALLLKVARALSGVEAHYIIDLAAILTLLLFVTLPASLTLSRHLHLVLLSQV